MTTKKTALLGGSFDPVHNGHIQASVQIRKKLGLDRVVFVPNYQNPLKNKGAQAPADKRLQMLKLAVSGIDGLEVSPVEVEKKSVSYTVETLRLWKARREDNSLWLVMGHEIFLDMEKWKNFKEIFKSSNVAVISRTGTDVENKPEPPFEIKGDFLYDRNVMGDLYFIHKSGSTLSFVKIKAPDISSTEIRKRVKNGTAFEHLVPVAVGDFIKSRKLYSEEFER